MSKIDRQKVVAEAKTWLGTPFVHQGRLRGVGVDCAGVVEMTAKGAGLYLAGGIAPYLPSPNPTKMRAELRRHLDEIKFEEVLPGDVLWFRVDRDGQHLGILSDSEPLTMVHAFGREQVMKCIEQRVDGFWRERIVGCYRYRGIQ